MISPLSSPEYVHAEAPRVPLLAERAKGRRRTHDLEEERVSLSPVSKQLPPPSVSWSFLDRYNDVVWLDKEDMEFPFDENGDAIPLPSVFDPSESLTPSSQGSSVQGTHARQDDVSTPLPPREGVRGQNLLGETLELGNCTYEIDQNNLTMTLTKLNNNRAMPADGSPFACGVSSTPMRDCSHSLISNLVTSHAAASVKSHLNFDNVMYKSPIHSPKALRTRPFEVDIKPADSTVDLETGCDLDKTINLDEELLKAAPTVSVAEAEAPTHKAAPDNKSKKPSHLPAPRRRSQRSVLPVVSGKSSKNKLGGSLLQGLRAASSTSSLSQCSSRSSLLPTSLKSRSHDRINAVASSGHSLKKLH